MRVFVHTHLCYKLTFSFPIVVVYDMQCLILFLYSFIIARSRESGNPCGFVNFRFDLDDGVEVAYW